MSDELSLPGGDEDPVDRSSPMGGGSEQGAGQGSTGGSAVGPDDMGWTGDDLATGSAGPDDLGAGRPNTGDVDALAPKTSAASGSIRGGAAQGGDAGAAGGAMSDQEIEEQPRGA